MRMIKPRRCGWAVVIVYFAAFICWGIGVYEKLFVCQRCAIHMFVIGLLLGVIASMLEDGIRMKKELLKTKKSA